MTKRPNETDPATYASRPARTGDLPELRLTIEAPYGERREIDLGAVASIGRAADNTIRIEDSNVSRYHAVVEARDGRYWLRDLCSTNGTVLNRKGVEFEAVIRAGDEIVIGGVATIAVVRVQRAQRRPVEGPGS